MANLKEIESFLIRVAKQAGAEIWEAYQQPQVGFDRKKYPTDPVTETDLKVEKYVYEEIKRQYPNDEFIGEETVAANQGHFELTDAPTWICDPVDGTASFIHRFPFCCVSLAYCNNKQIQVGVVFSPALNELYTAVRGQGSFLTNLTGIHKLRVSQVSEYHDAMIITEWGSNRDPAKIEMMLTNLEAVLKNNTQTIRSLGSCALDLCMVARGSADLYYEWGPSIWDYAAGMLIVIEAGGVMLSPTGDEFRLGDRGLLVCNVNMAKKFKFPHFEL